MNEPSADYTDTDVSASSSGASFFAGRGERLVLNHKGSWEGYRRQGGARFLLPAFLCAQIFIGKETCGYEAADICCRCQWNDSFWTIRYRFLNSTPKIYTLRYLYQTCSLEIGSNYPASSSEFVTAFVSWNAGKSPRFFHI